MADGNAIIPPMNEKLLTMPLIRIIRAYEQHGIAGN